MIGKSDDETNFPHKLLATNRQAANLRRAFAKHTSTDIKLSESQLSKMIQSGGFLGRLLGSLLRTGLPLTKNVIKPLPKSVLVPLGLTMTDQLQMQEYIEKILGSDHNTTLVVSNNKMQDILKIVKSLEYSGILLKMI